MVASKNPGSRRSRIKLFSCAIAILIAINAPVYLLAYHMTHVRLPGKKGIGVPKPQNSSTPEARGLSYTTHRIPINQTEWLEAWRIPTQQAASKGTVVLFHGNLGTKGSQLIPPAQSFSALGYDSLLIDFRGVGGSSGNRVTIGMREAQDVSIAFNYARQMNPQSPIILYGVSMGSAAILRAIAKDNIKPNGIILELPFARLVNAIRRRLQHHRIPGFPIAEWVVFWGGIQHGVNGFAHNPVEFAKTVDCPTLVIHGAQDKWTTEAEIEALFENLQGAKKLVTSPNAGHHQLIGIDRKLWDSSVQEFFDSL